MRIAKQTHRRAYAVLTRLFVGQFFLFRRVWLSWGCCLIAAPTADWLAGGAALRTHAGGRAETCMPHRASACAAPLLRSRPPGRVLISNGYMLWLLRCVLHLRRRPWWAWAGVAVFAVLNSLNGVWLVKLVALARREQRQRRRQQAVLAPAGEAEGEVAGKAAARGSSGSGSGSGSRRVAMHAVTYQPTAAEGEDDGKKGL